MYENVPKHFRFLGETINNINPFPIKLLCDQPNETILKIEMQIRLIQQRIVQKYLTFSIFSLFPKFYQYQAHDKLSILWYICSTYFKLLTSQPPIVQKNQQTVEKSENLTEQINLQLTQQITQQKRYQLFKQEPTKYSKNFPQIFQPTIPSNINSSFASRF